MTHEEREDRTHENTIDTGADDCGSYENPETILRC